MNFKINGSNYSHVVNLTHFIQLTETEEEMQNSDKNRNITMIRFEFFSHISLYPLNDLQYL